MMMLSRVAMAAVAVFFYVSSALAQTPGAITNHAFVIGKGPGSSYTSLLCGSAQLAVGQSAADPICRTITGDVSISAGGVTALVSIPNSSSLTSASLVNNNVFGVLNFKGSTSGTAAVTAQAIAGTPTLTLPNTSGTFAVGATSPLILNTGSGMLTCPSCATFSGNALAPGITSSSLTAFGTSPALTGTPTAPTASLATNTTQIATTQFVQSAVAAGPAGVASLGGATGNITLAPELAIASSVLGLAIPPRGAALNLNGTNQSWIPPNPNKYKMIIAGAIKYNQGGLWTTVSGGAGGAFKPASGAHLIRLWSQTWIISGAANAPANWVAKWIKNATVDGSFNLTSGTDVCAGIGAVSDVGAGSTVMHTNCEDQPSSGDYYNLFLYVDSTTLGSAAVTIDGNNAHTYFGASVDY